MDKGVRLIRNLQTSVRDGNPRVFIESTPLEAGGFNPGDPIQYTFVNDAIVITKVDELKPDSKIVSKRKRPNWKKHRPLIDYTNKELHAIFRLRERIDILVSEGTIVVRRERSFDLCVIEKPLLEGNHLKKLRLYSVPSGAGIATAALTDTSYYASVGGADIWDLAIDTYNENFKDGSVYFGDVRHLNQELYVPKADVCWLSPSCVEFSSLGGKMGGITEGMGGHYARVVLATGAKAIMIEQVPAYFKSRSFHHLQRILSPIFKNWYQMNIDSYDIGSVSSRKRGYAVATRDDIGFEFPALPKLPDHRRKTVQDVIGKEWEEGEWRTIEGTVMNHLLNKKCENNNFSAEKNRTLIGLDDKKVACFIANYSKIQATSSYLLHPDQKHWRPFTSREIANFLSVPEWFSWPEWISEGKRTVMLGNSVDCEVVRAIGIELSIALMSNTIRTKVTNQSDVAVSVGQNNQMSFVL